MSKAKSLAVKLSAQAVSKKIKNMESIRSTCRRELGAIKSVIRYIIPLAMDDDADVRLTASKLVLDFSKLDPKAVGAEAKPMIDLMKKAFGINMDEVDINWEPYANIFIAMGNISEKHPDIGGRFVFLMIRALKYPIYHPERPLEGLHLLYAASIRAIGKLGVVTPAYVKDATPLVYKALLDSFRFQFWRKPLKKKDEDMKYCATETLTNVGIVSPGLVVPYLSTAFLDKDRTLIKKAREILSMLSKNLPQLFPALMDALCVEKKKLREHITSFTVELGMKYPAFMIPQLTSRLEDPRKYVRFHCASALGELFPANPQYIPSVIPVLIDHLANDPDLDVRQTVSDALNVISTINTEIFNEYLKNVIDAMADEYHHVRWRTAQIVKNIGERRPDLVYESVPYLIAGLDDRHDHVGWKCREALEVLGVDKVEYQLVVRSIKVVRDLIKKARELAKVEVPDIEKMVDESSDLAKSYRFKESIELSVKAKELIELKVPFLADGGSMPFPGQVPPGYMPQMQGYPQMGYPQRPGVAPGYPGMPQQMNQAPPQAAQASAESQNEKNLKKYGKLVRKALEDGVISEDEEVMLKEMRDLLDISAEEHEMVLAEEKAAMPKVEAPPQPEEPEPPEAAGDVNWDEYDTWEGEGEEPQGELDLDDGYTYLLSDDDPSDGFEYLKDALAAGRKALFVTRNHPRKIIRKYGLDKASHIWLTKMPGENNLKPDQMGPLKHATEDFLKNAIGGMMMVEGLDYIISLNGYDPVIAFVRFLKDMASVTETIVIISASPSVMKKNELKTLELEVDSIL